jgi:hypothetical protein
MFITGVDYHPSFQQIAFLDRETGECGERRLNHGDGEAGGQAGDAVISITRPRHWRAVRGVDRRACDGGHRQMSVQCANKNRRGGGHKEAAQARTSIAVKKVRPLNDWPGKLNL